MKNSLREGGWRRGRRTLKKWGYLVLSLVREKRAFTAGRLFRGRVWFQAVGCPRRRIILFFGPSFNGVQGRFKVGMWCVEHRAPRENFGRAVPVEKPNGDWAGGAVEWV